MSFENIRIITTDIRSDRVQTRRARIHFFSWHSILTMEANSFLRSTRACIFRQRYVWKGTCGKASVKYNWVNPEMITAMRLESDYAAIMEPMPFNPNIKYDFGEALSKFASFSAASITHIYYVHFHDYALYYLENLHTQNRIFIVQMSF